MKKILVMAVLALASFSVSAQNFYVGGSLGFWHDSNNSNTGYATNSLTILPEFGYNLTSNWAVGTTIGYNYTHLCNTGISNNIFQFNPYARYTYFKSDNNFINLFLDGTVGVGAGWTSYEDENDSKTACTYQIGVAPGLAINFTDKFSFVTHIGFVGYKGANNAAQEAGYKSEGGLLLNSQSLSFGFYYNF